MRRRWERCDSSTWKRLMGDIINVHLIGDCKIYGAELFSVVPHKRTRSNKHKLIYRKSHLNIRKSLFTVRVVKHRNTLPRELLESQSLQILRIWPGSVLGKLFYVTLLWAGGWTRWSPEVPIRLNYPVILWWFSSCKTCTSGKTLCSTLEQRSPLYVNVHLLDKPETSVT